MLFNSFDHVMQDGKVLESAALEMVNHDGAKMVAFAVCLEVFPQHKSC